LCVCVCVPASGGVPTAEAPRPARYRRVVTLVVGCAAVVRCPPPNRDG
jgi:hypothetical protein